MSPRKHTVDAAKGVMDIEWPFFGELSRGLALKVARAYDPELVIGIATAGVIPGAVIQSPRLEEFFGHGGGRFLEVGPDEARRHRE